MPGLNEYDRERAHHQAKESSRKLYDEHYIDNHGADEYDPNRYGRPSRFEGQGSYDRNQDQDNY